MSNLDVEQCSLLDGRLQVAACSHVGRRDTNEDAYRCAPRLGLVAVADGMGGHHAGDVAAWFALEALEGALASVEGYATVPAGSLDALWSAVHEANTRVFEAAYTNPNWVGMGTTLSALLFVVPQVALAHVGDSRVYRLRRLGELEQMTQDHAHDPPLIHMLKRAIGAWKYVEVDERLEDVHAEDRWLICSDGLTRALADWELQLGLNMSGAADAARWLVARALDRGACDNVTVVVVEVSATWGL
jgi:protein phosphatase